MIIFIMYLLGFLLMIGLILINALLRESNEKLFDLTKHLDKEEKHYE